MQKTCKQCSAPFEITAEDLAFYEKVSPEFGGKKYMIPPPTLCPECRQQRRLAYRNERSLHHRVCDKTGKSIISMYAPHLASPVYENSEWWKDDWSALTFGRAYNPQLSFYKQWQDLMNVVPKMARVQQGENVNSQYTNCASNNKDCYLIFSSNIDEDCYYGTWVLKSQNCTDCQQILRCELCYECIDCVDCYRCKYIRDCTNCSESMFLKSCSGCRNCFGCIGLTQKEYCMFNQQLSATEYQRRMNELYLDRFSVFEKTSAIMRDAIIRSPVRFYEGLQNEHVSGNHLTQSTSTFESYDCNAMQDCKWCSNAQFFKDSYDVSYYGASGTNELIYEAEGVGHGTQGVLFSKLVWGGCANMLYCYECFASQNCFGCAGLRNANYCILNKQYTKKEYEALVPKIIEKMKADGEWGEFFPVSMSPFGYNETVAQEYFPMSKEEVIQRGWKWHEEEETKDQYMGPAYAIPDSIKDVGDDITKQILRCEVTSKPYKIIPQELKFYREMNIPIPRRCPDQRHKDRMALRNPRKLWSRQCAKCQMKIETTYAPNRPEIVYCETCYLSTVY